MSPQAPTEDRSACTACRGTGRVISNLGGSAHEISCPWCGGDGAFHAGHDAQQAQSAERDSASPADT